MRRRLITLALAANWLLLALLLAAWARSYFYFDYLHFGSFWEDIAFSINGDIGAGNSYWGGVRGSAAHWDAHRINAATPSLYAEGLGNALAGLVAFKLTWRPNEHTLQLPYWSLTLLAAVPLILHRWLRRRALAAAQHPGFPIHHPT